MRRVGWLVAIALAGCSRASAPAPEPASASAAAYGSASAYAPASASASPSAPPPSLACRPLDVRTAEARSRYGDDVHLATIDGTFLFVDPDHGPFFSDVLRLAPRVLAALRHDRIAARPLCPVSVYVFSSLDRFNEHCADRHYVPESGRHLGVYDRIRGEVVTDLSGGKTHVPTCAHELAHVLMDADWDAAAGVGNAPLWFRECVASLYESPSLPDDAHGVIHGTDDWRYIQLRAAVVAHDPAAHLGALFGMSDAAFRGRTDGGGTDAASSLLHRAMARATCQSLDAEDTDQLWRLYRAWRDDFAADPDGVASFTRVTGRPPTAEEADRAWRAWVLRTR
jgi:hypothetical protein